MTQEREQKRPTRRQFLKTGVVALAWLSSCVFKGEPSEEQPTKTPSPTETIPPTKAPPQESSPLSEPTFAPEPTSTPEVISIPGIILTEEYLKNAFAGIGGERQVKGETIAFYQHYFSQRWGEEINFANLPQSPIDSLKCLIFLCGYLGVKEEGFSTWRRLRREEEEISSPKLKDLSFLNLTLRKVPLEGWWQREREYPEGIYPRGLLLWPSIHIRMTVVGLLNEPKSEGEITVDKETPGGEPNSVLVAFSDFLRGNEYNEPRCYLAILPTHSPTDPENKNALTLENLLKANGYQYNPQSEEITAVNQDNQKVILGLNRIEGEELIKDLRQAVGLGFVDQINGELIKNPIVPYYEEMPAIWEVEEIKDEEGNIISFLLKGQGPEGKMVDVAKAKYYKETEKWGWQPVESSSSS